VRQHTERARNVAENDRWLWCEVMRTLRVARIMQTGRFTYERCHMQNLTSTIGESGDLFGAAPSSRSGPAVRRRLPLELKVAGALCRQLRRQPAARDKQRIAHLICLNLVSVLRKGARGA
jgi:hypothetical protein